MAERKVMADSALPGHELSDLKVKNIALFGAALATLVVAALIASYALYNFFYAGVTRSRPQPSPLSYNREPTPEPRLMVKSGDEMKAMRAEENKILNGYDWVDRDKGIVRLPIERAIEIIAERGLAVRGEAQDKALAERSASRRKGQNNAKAN
jgi:hypothetical protein